MRMEFADDGVAPLWREAKEGTAIMSASETNDHDQHQWPIVASAPIMVREATAADRDYWVALFREQSERVDASNARRLFSE